MKGDCWCGHSKEDHKDGTGQCKECDINAGYGGNDSCSHYHVRPIETFKPKKLSLEERVARLEAELKQLKMSNICYY